MSKRTKTRMGHANPTSERNRRKERHSLHTWGVSSPSYVMMMTGRRPCRNKKRSSWLARQAARGANDGTN
jgi:hypothetical protein